MQRNPPQKMKGSPKAPLVASRKRRAAARSGDDFRLLGLVEFQLDLFVGADVDGHPAAIGQLAEKKLFGKRLADRILDKPRHRPGAHLRIEAFSREELLERHGKRGLDLLLVQLALELEQELVDDAQDHVMIERSERDGRVEAVSELRREHALDRLQLVTGLLVVGE